MSLYLTVIPACHVLLTYCTKARHGSGYLRCNFVFMFKITYCCFNFYSLLQVLFIADAKISFDSFRNGMTATVNSKTVITVNPGKKITATFTKTTGSDLMTYCAINQKQNFKSIVGNQSTSCGLWCSKKNNLLLC